MAVSTGFPRAKNDKLIVKYDGGIQTIRHDPMYTEQEYKLVDYHGNEYMEKGAYVIVYGGYH
ncbi:unnamed protein product, partial [Discosporangium mesarthrocarpum]